MADGQWQVAFVTGADGAVAADFTGRPAGGQTATVSWDAGGMFRLQAGPAVR